MIELAMALAGEVRFWHWLALGLALLVAELATGSTYLLWPAVAAWIAGVALLLFPLGFAAQLGVFAVAAIALTILGRRYLRGRWLAESDAPAVNEPAQRLIGARAVAEGSFEGGVGRVRLGDTLWRAETHDPVGHGDAVEVVAVSGATLFVRRILALP